MAGRHGLWLCTLLLILASTLTTTGARAEPAHTVKHGTMVLGEWTDAVKTDNGKEARRYRAVYDWDTGLTHEYAYTLDGKLVSERSYRGAPAASPEEVEQARAIVLADPEVTAILRRQPEVSLQGGFAMEQTPAEGPCTERTRCVQMLLFDGNNVVRHMLVDLHSGSILERDYIPPRNRGAAK